MTPDVADRGGLRGILAGVDRLELWLHLALVTLTVASAWRYINGHGFGDQALVILTFAGLLLAVYAAVPIVNRSGSPVATLTWCLTLLGVWLVLVLLAPSFAWVAVPIAFVALRVLPFTTASVVVTAMMVAVVGAWASMLGKLDPTIVAGPVCIAGLAVLAYRQLERESAARQHLLDELRDAQGDLAEAQHDAGVLAERTRLSREIHDSVAQGLTSINLLLQAAEQQWATDPNEAHEYVGRASFTARDSLDEVRRVVRDLAPAELADPTGDALAAALHRSGTQIALNSAVAVTVRIHGDPAPVSADVSTALIRSVRGALANVVEHADASEATVSLTYQPGSVTLDVRDNGIGFDPYTVTTRHNRGRGLTGIRSRAQHFGGQLAVESAPGEGTAVAVQIPTNNER